VSHTQVTDEGLAHLKNCKALTQLYLSGKRVTDEGLAHLKGMPLRMLSIRGTGVTDLNPLQGMPLEKIYLTPKNITQGLAVLRDMKSLKTIGIGDNQSWPAAEFWERYDKGEFGLAPFTDADAQRIAALPAAEQVEEVRKELKKRNPDFNGIVEHRIEGDVVTEIKVVTDKVTDIAPIRVFNALRVLDLSGTELEGRVNGQLADLTPLKGMNLSRLTRLSLNNTKIGDAGLIHFKDCKNLTHLWLNSTLVSSAGMASFKDCKRLTALGLKYTQVNDAGLVHFKDCKGLTGLDVGGLALTEKGLANFKDCPDLAELWLNGRHLDDAGLAQFQDCKNLTMLHVGGSQVTDAGLVHLKGCKKLNTVWLDGTRVTDAGLTHLTGLDELTKLILVDTKVTTKGAEDLAKALPKCMIKWDGSVIEPK
jgi:Leucine-rich repeat (LRR) protein